MTNLEKYYEDIWEKVKNMLILDCAIFRIRENSSSCPSEHNCKECRRKSIAWLLSEYELPYLENADNLKIGDWIMVKDDDTDWVRGQFIAFSEGKFITSDGVHILKWDYARLLEYGD